jgi:hypothetical protein
MVSVSVGHYLRMDVYTNFLASLGLPPGTELLAVKALTEISGSSSFMISLHLL